MPERDLIKLIQQGSKEAFRRFYEEHASSIYRYILMRVTNSQDAEELVSEVFVRAWKAMPDFKWDGTPIRAWLLRISYNLVVDYWRQRKEVSELPWQVAYLERRFSQIDRRDELRRALVALSYEEQVILHLNFVEGYNLNEIAQFLDKQDAAVRIRKYRALKRLRAVLDRQRATMDETSPEEPPSSTDYPSAEMLF